MDRDDLYRRMAERKADPTHAAPYVGGNGRIDRFLDLVRSGDFPRGGFVLDVGGSHGDLVDISVREGLYEAGLVIDISEYAVDTATKRGLHALQLDVDRQGLAGYLGLGGFDAVVALDFIEHIVDPESFAHECFSVLKPGGSVFINTPNISYWRHVQSLVCNGVFPHTSGDREVYHGGHLAFYNELDIRVIFGSAGFTDFRVFGDPSGSAPPPIWDRLLEIPDRDMKCRMLGSPNLLISCRKS